MNDELDAMNDDLPDTASALPILVRPIWCEECERAWDDQRERWRMYVACFTRSLVVAYCPECAEREFGGV